MKKKEFLNAIGNSSVDILQKVLHVLDSKKIKYCVIGGLAVNAYVEPVVSLDLDIVIIASSIEEFLKKSKQYFKIKKFPHSLNLNSARSDLRIQVQTDPRYQAFIEKASIKKVLGYVMRVAQVSDVLKGKIWAFSDKKRRGSKRQKDLADIMRIIEKYPRLKTTLPKNARNSIKKISKM